MRGGMMGYYAVASACVPFCGAQLFDQILLACLDWLPILVLKRRKKSGRGRDKYSSLSQLLSLVYSIVLKRFSLI